MIAITAALLQLVVLRVSSIEVSYETPDGRFSVISDGSNFVKFQVPNLRYVGTTNLPVEGTVSPDNVVNSTNMLSGTTFCNALPSSQMTGLRPQNTFDTRNLWTMSIFRLSDTSVPSANASALIGFSHCEDDEQESVWKSVHVVMSADLGVTWTRPVPILTAQERQPESPVPTYNGGLGDMVVVWDRVKRRWYALHRYPTSPATS